MYYNDNYHSEQVNPLGCSIHDLSFISNRLEVFPSPFEGDGYGGSIFSILT